MKFTEKEIKAINKACWDKKRANPINKDRVGLYGLSLTEIGVDVCGWTAVEDLGRLIEELQMLKEAIEEEKGIVL